MRIKQKFFEKNLFEIKL